MTTETAPRPTAARPVVLKALTLLGVLVVVLPTIAVAHWFFSSYGGRSGHDMMSMPMMGMPMWMHQSMWAIPAGILLVGYSAYLRRRALLARPAVPKPRPSRRATAMTLLILIYVMVIDISKTSSLGFVMPGMQRDYQLSTAQLAILPTVALIGATAASFLGGWLTDRFGTRTMVVFSGLGFTGTAMCGVMPTFTGNLVMCFFMGSTVGALVPVVFSLLAWLLPARRVAAVGALLAGMGSAGGYALAASLAALLGPEFGWRAIWLSGTVTGPLLLLGCLLIPEWVPQVERVTRTATRPAPPAHRMVARRTSLTMYGLVAGVLSLGYLTWLPSLVRDAGMSAEATDELLSMNAWLTLPIVIALALALSRWHFGACLAAIAAGGGIFIPLSSAAIALQWSGPALTFSIAGVVLVANAMVAAILSISSTWYEGPEGATGLGVVAGASKFGGLIGPPMVGVAAGAPATFIVGALVLGAGTLGSGVFLQRANARPRKAVPEPVPEPVQVPEPVPAPVAAVTTKGSRPATAGIPVGVGRPETT